MLQILSWKTFKFTIHTPNQVSYWKWKLAVLFCQKITRKCLANVEGKWYIFSQRCSIFNVRSAPVLLKEMVALFSIFGIFQVNYFHWKIHTAIFKAISTIKTLSTWNLCHPKFELRPWITIYRAITWIY